MIDEIDSDELIDDYPAVRYYPPASDDDELYLDVLTRLGDFASYDDLETQDIDVEGVKVRVATRRRPDARRTTASPPA